MGFLQATSDDAETLPSLVASDAVQEKYLNTTDYLDQLCLQGALDYEIARHLKREMYQWATMQMCLLLRIEELESEFVDNAGGRHDTEHVCSAIGQTDYEIHEQHTCSEQHTSAEDEHISHTKITTHSDTQVTHNNIIRDPLAKPQDTIQTNQHEIEHEQSMKRSVYNTDKCRRYIKPIYFTSGGFNIKQTSQHSQDMPEGQMGNTGTKLKVSTSGERTASHVTKPEQYYKETTNEPLEDSRDPLTIPDDANNTHINGHTNKTHSENTNNTHTNAATDKEQWQSTQPTRIELDGHKGQSTTYTFDNSILEENMRLSRLENRDTFQTALRLVTRLGNSMGQTICFPTTEQTDRLILKSVNLPTNLTELTELLRKACARRGETLILENVYKDLARAHGRVYFDEKQKGHKCFVYVRHP